ncbi:MAG TPA: epimerase, partial [Aliiroseovarius sp.]|nr:epimerase [Aliiroseovarius sp.]
MPAQTARLIEVAEAGGATLLQPANVYVYGAESPERMAPDTPHRAMNPLGKVRREMEQALRRSSARVILLR